MIGNDKQTRREALKNMGKIAAGALVVTSFPTITSCKNNEVNDSSIMPVGGEFKMMELKYAENRLEPIISSQTISFHYGKHLQTYVNNLNKALPESGLQNLSLQEVVKKASGGLFNNAGQVLNHMLYFSQFSDSRIKEMPDGTMLDAINKQFGSYEAFQNEYVSKGASLFGSGWVWLSSDNNNNLVISQEANAGNPVTSDLKPLLTFDVWEHAYYLDYQNRRQDYLSELWKIVDWTVISTRFLSK